MFSVASVTATNTADNSTETVTEDFELDDGQRESFYDFGRLYLKDSAKTKSIYTNTARRIDVTYSHFTHGGISAAPFIGKHAYTGIAYEQIPLFTNSKTGKTVSLANCLDFRHSGPANTSTVMKPYGESEGFVNEPTTESHNYYLPRIDKLCVKADPEDGSPLFFLIGGTPDLAPIAPPDPQDALVIATVNVPAYTHSVRDVTVIPVDTKRFTMADIGKIEKRIDDVEVFAKLSLSETEIEARSLKTTASQNEPLKTSIFSDEFYGHSVSDVSDSLHSCSVDFERGEMRPFFTSRNIDRIPRLLIWQPMRVLQTIPRTAVPMS